MSLLFCMLLRNWGTHEERGRTTIRASFHTLSSTPRQQNTTYWRSGGRHESLPPSWVPEAGMSHHYKTQKKTPSAAPTIPGVCRQQPPLGEPWEDVKHRPCCPRSAQRAVTPRRPVSRFWALPLLSQEWVDSRGPYKTQEQMPSSAPTVPRVCIPQPPLGDLRGGTKHYPCCPGCVQWPLHLHTPCQGNKGQTPEARGAMIL